MPVCSADNEHAITNPSRLREEAAGAAVVSSILGGGQALTQRVSSGAAGADSSAAPQNDNAAVGAAETKKSVSGEAESTAVNTSPAAHTVREQAVIDEYRNAVDGNLADYVEAVRSNSGAKLGRYNLKPVTGRAAKDIQALTGVAVNGNKTAIEPRIIEHILKEHGENGTTDHSLRDINDIARIQYVLDNYDNVEASGNSTAYRTNKANGYTGQAKTVLFSKAVNGTFYVVEAVPDAKAKTVFVVSAYMGNKKAGDVQAANAEATRNTSETKAVLSPVSEAVASNNSIRSGGAKVNAESKKSDIGGTWHDAMWYRSVWDNVNYPPLRVLQSVPQSEGH